MGYVTKYMRDASMCYCRATIARTGQAQLVKKIILANSIATFDTIKKGAYLALLRQGHTRGLAASLVGIHESGKADQDPEVLVEELGQKPGRSKGVIELGEDLAL